MLHGAAQDSGTRPDGLQRPDRGEDVARLGLVAMRGHADVLNAVCGLYGRRRGGGMFGGRGSRNGLVRENEDFMAHGLEFEKRFLG
jgi:hypothetical protein